MSGQSDSEISSKEALRTNQALAGNYYGVALPALATRQNSINQALDAGEPGYMQQAYEGQRAGLTEGLTAQGGLAQARMMASSKKAMSGGNSFADLHPADMGAQLANALYGSKYQEGQANLDQQFNLMNMALGGAGTTGSGALDASRQSLSTMGYLPNYNKTAANVWGAAALGSSLYGAGNQAGWFSGSGNTPPPGTSIVNPAQGGTYVA